MKERQKGLGGSDIASIVGLSPWRSKWELWAEKTGRIEHEDIGHRPAVEWGNRLEPVVGDKFADEHPELNVYPATCMYRGIKQPWMQASLDYELEDADGRRGVLEIKTTSARNARDWKDGVPPHYLAQVMWYLLVTGRQYAWVAVLIGGNDYREYFVEPDPEDMALLLAEAVNFWELVVNGIEPEENEARDRYLAELFSDNEQWMTADDDTARLIDAYVTAQDELRIAKDQVSELGTQIKKKIENATGVISNTHTVRWVRGTSNRLNIPALKREQPELVRRYTNPTVRDGGLRITKTK